MLISSAKQGILNKSSIRGAIQVAVIYFEGTTEVFSNLAIAARRLYALEQKNFEVISVFAAGKVEYHVF
jgi:hypothetical protein